MTHSEQPCFPVLGLSRPLGLQPVQCSSAIYFKWLHVFFHCSFSSWYGKLYFSIESNVSITYLIAVIAISRLIFCWGIWALDALSRSSMLCYAMLHWNLLPNSMCFCFQSSVSERYRMEKGPMAHLVHCDLANQLPPWAISMCAPSPTSCPFKF